MSKTMEFYQIDAFTDSIFGGNPAAVCVMDNWLEDELMQKIALENNLSETAFVVRENDGFGIRWFTPAIEVALCGHATLASAYVLFHHLGYERDLIRFQSKSGLLEVSKDGKYLKMDFPADSITKVSPRADLENALGVEVDEFYKGKTDYLCIMASEEQVKSCSPDFGQLKKLNVRGVIISAPGDHHDFVSRFFAPGSGVDEDPVTGSAHTSLCPYWSNRLEKKRLKARQISARGGDLICEFHGDRVHLFGQAVTYAKATMHLP